MSRKRRNTSSPEPSPPSRPHKRVSPGPALSYDDDNDDAVSLPDPQRSDEKPRVSTLFGQTGAFPGLGDEDDGELFYGPADDGLAYLRMVRSEARGVPSLLLAPRDPAAEHDAETKAEEKGVEGGYWDEETYIAAPLPSVADDPKTQLCAAQIRYYDSLLAQFRLLQATLRCTPPLEAVKAMGKERLISLPRENEKARMAWERHIREAEPAMVQMASVDGETGWELVELVGELLEKSMDRDEEVLRRLGAWVWAVLGKCPERGMCGADEVAELRALARKAVELLEERGGIGDGRQTHARSDGDDGMSGGKALVMRDAVLDMIITAVGEVYGQRDLLESRRIWQRQGT